MRRPHVQFPELCPLKKMLFRRPWTRRRLTVGGKLASRFYLSTRTADKAKQAFKLLITWKSLKSILLSGGAVSCSLIHRRPPIRSHIFIYLFVQYVSIFFLINEFVTRPLEGHHPVPLHNTGDPSREQPMA